MAAVGVHYIVELYRCPEAMLDDLAYVRDALREAAKLSRSTLLEEVCHRFEPQGVTALALLAESHISIHTWPECGYAAADIFTCGQNTTPARACDYLVRHFEAGAHSIRKLQRGAHSADGVPGDAGDAADQDDEDDLPPRSAPGAREQIPWQVPRYAPISG